MNGARRSLVNTLRRMTCIFQTCRQVGRIAHQSMPQSSSDASSVSRCSSSTTTNPQQRLAGRRDGMQGARDADHAAPPVRSKLVPRLVQGRPQASLDELAAAEGPLGATSGKHRRCLPVRSQRACCRRKGRIGGGGEQDCGNCLLPAASVCHTGAGILLHMAQRTHSPLHTHTHNTTRTHLVVLSARGCLQWGRS